MAAWGAATSCSFLPLGGGRGCACPHGGGVPGLPAPPLHSSARSGRGLCPIKESGCASGRPKARPASSLPTPAGPELKTWTRGGGCVGGWPGAPWPIAGPCCGLLTWRAESCCNHGQRPEVRAKCKGLLQREALPQALCQPGEGGKRESGGRGPLGRPPPWPAPPWLAGTLESAPAVT